MTEFIPENKHPAGTEEERFWLRWNMAFQVLMLDLYIGERL